MTDEVALESAPTKKCPVCQTDMDSRDTNKVLGFRDNIMMLLIDEPIKLLYCPQCSTTVLYDEKEISKIVRV